MKPTPQEEEKAKEWESHFACNASHWRDISNLLAANRVETEERLLGEVKEWLLKEVNPDENSEVLKSFDTYATSLRTSRGE